MATWKIVAVTGRTSDDKVTEAHWSYGSRYGSVGIDGNKNANFLALAKAALGADRVAEIEAQEALADAISKAPEFVTVAPDKLDEALAVKPDKAKRDAVTAARATVDSVKASAEAARAAAQEAERDAQREAQGNRP